MHTVQVQRNVHNNGKVYIVHNTIDKKVHDATYWQKVLCNKC